MLVVALTLLRALVTLQRLRGRLLPQLLQKNLELEALHQAQEEPPLRVVLLKKLLLAALLVARLAMVARLLVKS
jgi:hypothetical protein